MLMFLATHAFPHLATLLGISWLIGKSMSTAGYQSGNVKNKDRGLIPTYITGYVWIFGLSVLSVLRALGVKLF